MGTRVEGSNCGGGLETYLCMRWNSPRVFPHLVDCWSRDESKGKGNVPPLPILKGSRLRYKQHGCRGTLLVVVLGHKVMDVIMDIRGIWL